jgi:tetratricopeptide (TPR) repeat protein
VIRLVGDQPGGAPPREAAYIHSHLADAAAFNRARDSSIDELAALAGNNLGVVPGELGRPADAVAAYKQLIDRYGGDPAPELREQVAKALYNKGVVLAELGGSQDAVAACAAQLRSGHVSCHCHSARSDPQGG